MSSDKPLLGVLLMTGFCVMAPMGDAIAKYLGAGVPLAQLLLARFAIQALLLVPVVYANGGTLAMSRRIALLTAVRTLLHIVGIGAMFIALRYLPLADALAIAFVMPFLMLLLGKVFAGEIIGWRRLAACVTGFMGTLLVIQPSFADVGAPALLPLLVAVAFALFMFVTRMIARETDPIGLQATSGIMASLLLAGGILIAGPLGQPEFQFAMVSHGTAWLLLAIGIIGTLAHLLMTWSLRFAPSATLAPVQYLEIPFATVIGLIVFGDLPDGLAAVGMMIIVAAGLYVVHREATIARQIATDTTTI
ncbi:MAG: DMT family transporter [Rhodospirillales bacterium]|nr:DMT family transporter [Rhodospirillales bacterium]MBO6788651.1 DMT family transporter [Rhodospirillales bacterium]